MTPIFADTAFYVALHNRRDALYARALTLAAAVAAPIITIEFVLVEVANFFKRPGDRDMFAAFDTALRQDPATTVVPASGNLYAQGLTLFAARSDKEWSLVDCTSFQVMTEQGLTFRALLKPKAPA